MHRTEVLHVIQASSPQSLRLTAHGTAASDGGAGIPVCAADGQRIHSSHSKVAILLLLAVTSMAAGASSATLVVCAPGYPGSTAEAQPAMDGLAAAATSAAGWTAGDLAAVYFETEDGGVEQLGHDDAALALVTLPFFLEHREELGLMAQAQAVPSERAASEPWSLVAGVNRFETAADLEGVELVSLAGHSPRFVRGPVLGGWGELPSSVTITFSGAVLSALRKAARGESVALVLDAHQAGALERLPFADKLEVVHRSSPLPVSLLCSVGDHLQPERTAELVAVLFALDQRPDATDALAGVRIDRFVAVDEAALERAIEAFDLVTE